MCSLPITTNTLLLVSKDRIAHNAFLDEEQSRVCLGLVKEGTFGGQPAYLVFFEMDLASRGIRRFGFEIQFKYDKVKAPRTTAFPSDTPGATPRRLFGRTRAKTEVQPLIVAFGPSDVQERPTGIGRETESCADLALRDIETGRKRYLSIPPAPAPGLPGATISVASHGNALQVIAKGVDTLFRDYGAPMFFQVGVVILRTSPVPVRVSLKYLRNNRRDRWRHIQSFSKTLEDNTARWSNVDSTTCNYTLLGRECTKNCSNFDAAHMSTKMWKRRLMDERGMYRFDRPENNDKWVSYPKLEADVV